MSNIFQRLARLVRHRWAEQHLRKALPPATLKELELLIAKSELGHTGQVRICVEAGAPEVATYVKIFFAPEEGVLTTEEKISKYHENDA